MKETFWEDYKEQINNILILQIMYLNMDGKEITNKYISNNKRDKKMYKTSNQVEWHNVKI